MKQQYKVGIYCRLSVDDASNTAKSQNRILSEESGSIHNQYELLSNFTRMNGWHEIKSYCDDGYSGGNFQRPAFLEMLEDARQGLINLILVKDLSRLGRDFVEVGRYVDQIFPALGCRFVSVLDGLDSAGDSTELLHLRSLMNDYFLKDLSRKIKSVLHEKMKSGQYLHSRAPYGYRRSEQNPYQLEVDEQAAAVVRQIFSLRYSGMGYAKIAATLTRADIPTPQWHWVLHYGNGCCTASKLWNHIAVKQILHNTIYIGTLKQNTSGTRSYKDSTKIHKPESEWIVRPNACEPIISNEVWQAVQQINQQAAAATKAARKKSSPKRALFAGKLFCSDCGSPLKAELSYKGKSEPNISYRCSRFVRFARCTCSPHSIAETALSTFVLQDIQSRVSQIKLNHRGLKNGVKKLSSASTTKQKNSLTESNRLRRQISKLEQATASLYERKVTGQISAEDFAAELHKNEQARQQATEQLSKLDAERAQSAQQKQDTKKMASLIRKHSNLTVLDKNAVDALIEHIIVGENKNIEIHYKFKETL